MNKTILKIILCSSLSVFNLIIGLYPTGKVCLKRNLCNLSINDLLTDLKNSEYSSLLAGDEEQIFNELNAFKKEFCNKINN